MNIILIAAYDKNRAIGFKNDLPWHLPDDFKRFKSITLNQTVVMGYNTALSFPKALPKRTNLVLTSKPLAPYKDMIPLSSIDEVSSWCAKHNVESLYVIGGAQIYKAYLDIATHLDLTFVDGKFDDADTFFPEVNFNNFKELSRFHHPKDDSHECSFDHVQLIRV